MLAVNDYANPHPKCLARMIPEAIIDGRGLVGLAIVVAVGLVLHAFINAIGIGVLAATGMAALATAIAVLLPLAHAYRANAADALRGE